MKRVAPIALFAALLPLGCSAEPEASTENKAEVTTQVKTEAAVKADASAMTEKAEAAKADSESNVTADISTAVDAEISAETTAEVAAQPEADLIMPPPEPYIAGTHYTVMEGTEDPVSDKVKVIEFFWYGCPTCNAFEPSIVAFKNNLPAGTEFVQIPGIVDRADWMLHARAFYTAEVLGVQEKIHPAMFEAIHKFKRNLRTERSIKQFFLDNGVTEAKYDQAVNSFAVNTKLRIAGNLANKYQTTGVPTVVVDGKYKLSPRQAGGFDEAMKVVRYLVSLEQ